MKTNLRAPAARAARAGTSLFALALALGVTATASAQDQVEEDAQEAVDADEATIIVTGFRQSLETATAVKRSSDQVVESVSAEDIGKLPDASIAESIARLPGVAAQRLNGRANVISIRGFGPDFSQTLLNGREQTSTGDNRAVEFDQYPSEVINQVLVYKSPKASLVGQGLVGTIDIRTIRPLDAGKQILAVGARGVYTDLGKLNAGSDDMGYRANATYVDQFADDTLGIALSASYVDEPYQIEEFNAWGYANEGGNALIGGSKSYVTTTQLKRLGLNGTLQWRPEPELTMTLDAFYSDFDDGSIKRGIELPLGFGGFFGSQFVPGSGTVQDGQIVSGTFTGVEGVVRNDINERKAKLYSFGYNVAWEGDDGWTATFDVGYSRTDRNELILESYAGTGFGNGTGSAADGAVDTISFTTSKRGAFFTPSLDYSNPDQILLTDSLGWGGSTIQAGYSNNRIVKDELKQYRLEIEKEFEGGFVHAVHFGLNYTDRDKGLMPDENFVLLAGGVDELRIPSQFLLRPTNLSYLGLGPMISYDPRQLVEGGVYTLRPNNVQDVFAKGFTIREDLMTAFLQADLQGSVGSAELTGNVGVQAINTDQESSGFIFLAGNPSPRTLGDSYWDILPSMNLSLRFPSDFVIRFAAAREIQRPRLDDLRVSIGYGLDQALGIISGGGGNPFLRPFRANAVDLTFEKYFGQGGYVAAQFFYKDLQNFIFQGERPFDYAGFPLLPGQTAPNIGLINQPVNVGGGELYGVEVAGNLPFSSIIPALEGFGVTGGVAYTETQVENLQGVNQRIPGYSKWVANGTAYFEKNGFAIRGSVRHRSSFLGELSVFGGARGNRQALGETIIDGQIGYDFQPGSALEGLSLFIQAQNLTDERFATVTDPSTPLQVIDYQIYGRRFYAGFNYKF